MPGCQTVAVGDSVTFIISGAYDGPVAKRTETPPGSIWWKYDGATVYSDSECTTAASNSGLTIPGADKDWEESSTYSKSVEVETSKPGTYWIQFAVRYRFTDDEEDEGEVAYATVKLVVGTSTLWIEEKSWTMSEFGGVEDAGTGNDHVPWYVLWNCDKHRFVIEVDDDLVDQVSSITIDGSLAARIPDTNKWERSVSSTSGSDVKATITLNDGNEISSNAVNWSKHDVEIKWEAIDEPKIVDGCNLSGLYRTGGYGFVTEVTVDMNKTKYNVVHAVVTISPEIPNGRKGTIYFRKFDPYGGINLTVQEDDNHGSIKFITDAPLCFDNSTVSSKKIVTVHGIFSFYPETGLSSRGEKE
jgi:hypothetical protein